jgi:hypothetical protein
MRLEFGLWRQILSSIKTTTLALRLNQPATQCVSEGLSPRLKQPMREIEYSPSSGTDIRNAWSYTCTVPKRLHGMGRDNFAFYLVSVFNPLTPELNSSAQRCLTRFLLGILLLEP